MKIVMDAKDPVLTIAISALSTLTKMPTEDAIATNSGAGQVVQTMMDNAAQNVSDVMDPQPGIVTSVSRIVIEITKGSVSAPLTGRMTTAIRMQGSVITYVAEVALDQWPQTVATAPITLL